MTAPDYQAQLRAAEVRGDRAEADARRYRWLRDKARQKTAYDVLGAGGHWSIGVHSADNNLTLDAAIDAAIDKVLAGAEGGQDG